MPVSIPHMTRLARLGLALAAAPLASLTAQYTPPPSRILYNARIWTGDPARPSATAIAMRRDTIVAVGSDSAVLALTGASTRREDLGGRQVVPGFHDAHWHLPTRQEADLTGAANVAEIVTRLRAFAATLPSAAWVTGRGWTPNMFPNNEGNRGHLDAAFPDRAVMITDRDGHQVLANSRALTLAGVSAETPDPAGGTVVRDATGRATGLLKETASRLVTRKLPAPTADEVYASLLREMRRAAEFGLTSLQIANGLGMAERLAFERAIREDSLRVRFRVAVPFAKDVSDSALRAFAALRDANRSSTFRFGIAKGMLDGTVDAGTAAMLAPYAIKGGTGLPRFTQAELDATVARYDSAGIQIELHAIGDRAIRMALDALAARARATGRTDRRHRIEHIEVPDPADIARFASLGVIASTQAIFASPDPAGLENYAPMLGPARAARAMPFRAFDDAGAIQAFGSDYPVFTMDPILGIYTAVTRQLPDGTPSEGWYPAHRISAEAALRHYTWGSAYAAFREEEIGTLRPGMLADLVVLAAPIIGVAPEQLLRARPVLTIMGGRDTYRAP